MYIFHRLLLIIDSLNKSEINYKIAHYIINNPDKVLQMSVRDLAKEVYVSPSAITRFLKTLDIKSYDLFKRILQYDLNYKKTRWDNKVGQRNLDISKEIVQSTLEILQGIDFSRLEMLLKKLLSAKRVLFYGDGDYLNLFFPLIDLLIEHHVIVENLSFMSVRDQEDAIKNAENEDVVLLFFPEKDFFVLYVEHVEFEINTLNLLEASSCRKFYVGLANDSFGAYENILIPFSNHHIIYHMVTSILVDYLCHNYLRMKTHSKN